MVYPRIDVMRRDVSKVYDNPTWRTKVSYMPDKQVFAIWNRFCEEGKFRKLTNRKTIHSIDNKLKRVDTAVVYESYQCEQLAFDI
jgi:hypothetical protein